jgi:hypothetical protein
MNLLNSVEAYKLVIDPNKFTVITPGIPILAGGPGSGRHAGNRLAQLKLLQKLHDKIKDSKSRGRVDEASVKLVNNNVNDLHKSIENHLKEFPSTKDETSDLSVKNLVKQSREFLLKSDLAKDSIIKSSYTDVALNALHNAITILHGRALQSLGSLKAGGPGSGRHKTGRKEKVKDPGRKARALETYVPSNAASQLKATINEKKLANALPGSVHLGDHAPFDIMIPKARIGIEVKSKFDGRKDTITMHPSSRQRKLDAAKSMKLKSIVTVIFDDRHGKIYYAQGVGSYKWKTGREHSTLKETTLLELPKIISKL